jgi:hypothetical protein
MSVTASLSPGWRFEQNRRMEAGLRVPLVTLQGVQIGLHRHEPRYLRRIG